MLPDPVITAIKDSIIDKLAEGLEGEKRKWVLKFHSDGKFKNELNSALERAVNRFVKEHEDQQFVDAIARNTDFWSLKTVQEAVKQIAVMPSSYLNEGFFMLRQTFIEVAPTVDLARVDAAVYAFLRCVSEEVMNIQQLAPIYQVQLQKISVQTGREMITLLQDANEIQRKGLLALLEAVERQGKFLLSSPTNLKPIDEDNIDSLKSRYFESIEKRYEYMDMGGISPRVTGKAESKIVLVRMEDVFIPLRARGEETVSHGGESKRKRIFEFKDTFEDTLQEEAELNGEEENEIEVVVQEGSYASSRRENVQVEIAEILENQKVVILGHPGAGKTTIVRYIAYMIAQKNLQLVGEHLEQFIPIILKASEYAKALKKDDGLSLYNFMIGKLFTDYQGPLFHWALRHAKGLVIINGLDEVPNVELRMLVASRIEQFVSDYWENRFIITSRLVGYRENQLTGNFVHFILTDLEKEQIINFLEKWYMAIQEKTSRVDLAECKQKALNLWEAIEANEGVKKLAGTPLLLTIIALVNYYGSELPERRVELYQLATETLLSNWPLKHRHQKINIREVLSLLEPIAYQIFIRSEDKLITEFDFRLLFEDLVRKEQGTTAKRAKTLSNQLLDLIEQQTGFFLKRGTNENGQDVYGFLHPTFAEYLTACYLADRWLESQLVKKLQTDFELELASYIHEASWHEVILLMAGHLGTMSERLATLFIEWIEQLEELYKNFLRRNLLLTAEIIEERVPINREKKEEIVSSLITLALNTSYIPLFNSIKNRLSGISKAYPFTRQNKQLKIRQVDSIEQQVRKVLLLRATGSRRKTDIEVLIQGLSSDEMTSELAQESMHSVLSDLKIERKPDESDKGQCLTLIEARNSWTMSVDSEQVIEKFIELKLPFIGLEMLGDNNIFLAKNIGRIWLISIRQFSQLSPSKMAYLKKFYNKKEDLPHQFFDVGFGVFLFEGVQRALLKYAVGEKDLEERQIALELLEWKADNSTSSDEYLEEFKRTLGKTHEIRQWRKALKQLMTLNEDPGIRATALKVLFFLSNNLRDRTNILVQGFNNSEKSVYAAAAQMAQFGWDFRLKASNIILSNLRRLLTDPSPYIRYASAVSLIVTENFEEKDIPILLKTFNGQLENSNELVHSMTCLLKLMSATSIPDLIQEISQKFRDIFEMIDDYDEELFFPIFDERDRRTIKEISKIIFVMLKSENTKTRLTALYIWESLNTKPRLGTNLLLSLLKDEEVHVRATLIHNLNQDDLKEESVLDIVLDYLKENDLMVAYAVYSALSKVKEVRLRDKIVKEVNQIVVESPTNRYAYEILWSLLVPSY